MPRAGRDRFHAIVDTKSNFDPDHRHPGRRGDGHRPHHGDARRRAERAGDHRPPERGHRRRSGMPTSPTRRACSPGCAGLSGAHFAVLTSDGRVTDATLPTSMPCPPRVRAIRPMERLDSLGDSPTLPAWTAPAISPCRSGRRAGPHDPSLLVLYPETSWRQAQMGGRDPAAGRGAGHARAAWRPSRAGSPTGSASGSARCSGRSPGSRPGDFERFDPRPRDRRGPGAGRFHQPHVRPVEADAAGPSGSRSGPGSSPSSRRAWPTSSGIRSPGPG